MTEFYRIEVGEYFGYASGYFTPDVKRTVVCDDSCTVGRYQLDFGNPPRFDWTGGPEGDIVSAIGPIAATEPAFALLRSIDPTLESQEIKVLKPKGVVGRRIEDRYRLVRPAYEAVLLPSSTTTGGAVCPKCGRAGPIQILGVEKTKGEGPGDVVPMVTVSPRSSGAGMHVSTRALGNHAIFSWAGMAFCTAEARRAIEASCLTNVAFRAYGELVDDEQ